MADPLKPRILLLGYARHGKDTVAELLRDRHGFSFRSSSHFLAETVVRPALAQRGLTYDSDEACYADRVHHRAAWHDIIADYNAEDPARLAKAILAEANVYVGMRNQREYEAARRMFDVAVWVDASGRGLEPEDQSSMQIEPCLSSMWWLDNGGTLEELEEKVAELVRSLSWVFDPTSLVGR